jgi:hypothetical protein
MMLDVEYRATFGGWKEKSLERNAKRRLWVQGVF